MYENNQAQDIVMENGGVQVKAEKKRKWKIPRINSAPMCYSMHEWAVRLSISDMSLGLGFAIVSFWSLTMLDESKEYYDVIKVMLIIIGTILSIVFFFGLMLFIGLCSKKFKILLRVYCWYASIISVIIFLLCLISAIYAMIHNGEIGTGFLIILVAAILSGYILYIDCVIYSIYMNIVENKEEINLKKRGC